MTFILIVSSVTMVLAVEAGHRLDKKGVVKWLLLTVVGGLFFVGSQGWEWYHFIHGTHYGSILTPEGWAVVDYNIANELILRMGRGLTVTGAEAKALFDGATATMQGANLIENEYAPLVPQYANFFFFITGFHGFHVFSGVVFNFIILVNVIRGVYDKRGHYEMVEKVGLYWHFVDLVWVFVFTFFYLL
jgi:cytochrome c oxidase subunit 3